MAKFLITGGTGFIGGALVKRLVESGHEAVVLTRNPAKHAGEHGDAVDYVGSFDDIGNSASFQAVINLAGEGIGDKRWSEKRKQALRESRIDLTRDLVACLERLDTRPEVMVSASAVGWYGAQGDKVLTEDSGYQDEFTHRLCQDWEDAAGGARKLGIRLCITRFGVVLGEGGGMLKKLLPPFYAGLGGRIGSGEQMLSWIHRSDLIEALNFLVDETQLEGVFNLTAPQAVTNAEFTRALGRAISRPTIFPLPGFVVKILFGEMGDRLLLHGQNVVPARLLDQDFDFAFPKLDLALDDIFLQ